MDTMTPSTDRSEPPGLNVDGDRPAMEWVTRLPKSWKVTTVQRLVLWAIACDSYDGVAARPGTPLLSAVTGIDPADVRDVLRALEKPTEHRPALLRREENRGRQRARLVLLDPRNLGSTTPGSVAQPGVQPGVQPGGQPGGQPGVHSPTAFALRPGMEEEAHRLVAAVADLIAEVDPVEARKARRSPKVLDAARKAAADGFVVADLLAVWQEQEVTSVTSGSSLALHLLGRLGKPLPVRSKNAKASKTAANTADKFPARSTQTLAEGAAGWSQPPEATCASS